ncbi:RHS repeat domain-containing protein [Streptomyces sp. NPDC058525]|uniref:RHS repeat domain-containing protein n=1 Tax=Streptomyces sp. NPDC058525 TaxID=3346538 RepID=UPI003651D675
MSCVPEGGPSAEGLDGFEPRAVQKTGSVKGAAFGKRGTSPVSETDKKPWKRKKVSWPAAAEGDAVLGAPAPAARSLADGPDADGIPGPAHTPVKGLPVAVAPLTAPPAAPPLGAQSNAKAAAPGKSAAPQGRTPEASAPGKLHVKVEDRKAAAKAGIDGVLLTVSRTDGENASGRASVQLDYSGFRHAYGADWGSRLRLVQLPACALTTPDKPECKAFKPLATHNDAATGVLTAEVDVAPDAKAAKAAGTQDPAAMAAPMAAPMAAGAMAFGGGTVLAAAASPDGAAGDFKATSLSPSGSWTAGGNHGGFAWSYPMAMPPVPGPLAPKVALSYNSSSVDGRTASANSQPSWVGEGWSMEMGFIERQYMGCRDDKGSGTNAPEKTGDVCWKSENAVLSLNGQNTPLVKDATSGAWKSAKDDGSRVEQLTGSATDTANGDDNNEYWRVTTPDGTQYWFGKNRLPGWTTGKEETDSTLTVPVFGNHAGEPGHGTSFANSVKDQGWRWNLDYVVDPHGNAMAFFYDKEENVYAKNSAGMTTMPKGSATYDRAGHLTRIEYGHRAGQVYAASAPAKVNFGVSDRCLGSAADCAFDKAHADNWPDTPVDQQCELNKDCINGAPSFWSKKRLTSVSTQVLKGGAYQDVDGWTLGQQFPDTGDAGGNGLWLSNITRTGKSATTPVTLPKVDFGGTLMANRVDAAEGRPPLNKFRITRISSETGSDTLVSYSAAECVAGQTPAPDATNTKRCYPNWWTPDGGSEPVKDFFHKYAVTKITENDKVAGSTASVTEYEYLGGIAWAKDTNEFTLDKHRAFSDFRGWGKVRTRTGTANKTLTEARYLRGIAGAQVTDSFGNAFTDAEQYAGMTLETSDYDKDGAGGTIAATAVAKPWSRETASQTRAGTTDLKAHQTNQDTQTGYLLLSPGNWRTTRSGTTFDQYGQVTSVSDEGDIAVSGDEACTRTTFAAADTANWMLSYPATVQRSSAVCATPATPANTLTEVRTSYDSKAHGTGPVHGQGHPTKVEELERYDGATPVFATVSTGKFDAYGRPLEQTDAAGNKTSTAYSPATGAQSTKTTATNAKAQTTVTTFDGLRGLPLDVTDVSGRITRQKYNALGQLTAAWRPGRDTTQPADVTFDYLTRNNAPTAVTAKTLLENGKYRSAITLYDGLLRKRQTQTDAHGGTGRLVKDTFFDSQGREYKTNGEYYNDQPAATVLLSVADNQIPTQTVTQFDGQGRVTAAITLSKGVEKWRSSTTYGGNWVASVPPQGGTASLALYNAQDKVAELRQYKDGNPVLGAPASAYDSLKYTYDADERITRLVDAAGNAWTTDYDRRGHQVKTTDPDKGAVENTYTADGKVATTTDARGVKVAHRYDELGRRTATFKDNTATGEKLAEWVYDTLPGGIGKLTSSTRYEKGNAYTTAVKGYDAGGRATGSTVTVPGAEGKLAGSYTFSTTFTPNTGLTATTAYPAGGGLAAETVRNGYTEFGLPTSVGNGTDVYSLGSQYSPFGEVLQTVLGDIGGRTVQTYTYEDHTRRLSSVLNDREASGPQTIDNKVYGYDPAGNITRIRNDRDDKTVADDQCFTYDYARRMTHAWASTDACALKPTAGTPTKPKVGGVDPYWYSYTYDAVGNRTQEVKHDPAGDPAKDVTRNSAYPQPGANRPHALDKVSTTGPGARQDSFEYDAAGYTTRRVTAQGDQKLTWDAEGHMATSTVGGKTSSFVYDANGNRLLRKDADKITLYLGNQELTLTVATAKVSGVRYYKAGQSTIVATSDGKLAYLLGDHHNTDEVQVDAMSMGYKRRNQTPFGTARGAQPAAGTWAGEKGFVGGTNDASTGLVHLNAREYDAANGRFISVDPVMDSNDPQQLNAYAYANNAPVTSSDPSGQFAGGFMPIFRPLPEYVKETYKRVKAQNEARRTIERGMKASGSYGSAWRAAYGAREKGSQRWTGNVGAGEDRGVIVVSFFIHTKDAMLGALIGDDRSYSTDPSAPYRMLVFWDTASGNVSFTVAPSHTAPKVKYSGGSLGMGGGNKAEYVKSEMLPALKIWGNEGSNSYSTLLTRNIIEARKSDSNTLEVDLHAVQPLMPVGSVDGHLTIAPNEGMVRRTGDKYPDMTVTQYRQGQGAQRIAHDDMAHTSGLPSLPLWTNMDRTWMNDRCTKGCE